MTSKGMCIDSALPDTGKALGYKTFAMAFSYPDDRFFGFFAGQFSEPEKDALVAEYDRLFRTGRIHLYGAEHLAVNEFERAQYLADIMGFYRAFGLEPAQERPDALTAELEFAHCLIAKYLRAARPGNQIANARAKADVCIDAFGKFFKTHLYPAAKKITELVIAQADNNFYTEMAQELAEFLKAERKRLTPD